MDEEAVLFLYVAAGSVAAFAQQLMLIKQSAELIINFIFDFILLSP
jgi:hypothetical protein